MSLYKLKVAIYDVNFYISIASTLESAALILPDCFEGHREILTDKCQAMFLSVADESEYAILLRNVPDWKGRPGPTHQQIHHECLHCAHKIMQDIGEPASWESETVAYLADSLVCWTYWILDQNKITVYARMPRFLEDAHKQPRQSSRRASSAPSRE
jgi:hypothetical protein